jgi:hypothetical protein
MDVAHSKTRALAFCVILFGACVAAGAQAAAPAPGTPQPAGAVPPPALSDFTPLLDQLQQTTAALSLEITRLRIERWKADAAVKRQSQQDADSITRNVTTALPTVSDAVRANPQNLAGVFKLYRNVSALYDVLSSLTEAAGTFGPKSEYAPLAGNAEKLDRIRRELGDKFDHLAAATDAEILRLRTEIASRTPPPAPKKIVIDDEEPKKKPVRKKTAKKPPESKPAESTGSAPTAKQP